MRPATSARTAPSPAASSCTASGDKAKNAQPSVLHIEGDPDHPVNRGTLCPKGAALIDFVHSETRTKYPMYRAPGSDELQARVVGLALWTGSRAC